MDPIKWLIVGNLLYSLFQFVTGFPLRNRKIPRNDFYGVRIKASLESDQRWYDINAYAGRQIVIWSAIPAANALAGFFIPREASDAYLVESLVLAPVAMLAPTILAFRWSRGR
jgi:hypothetical protein